jgi:hypothetical protein
MKNPRSQEDSQEHILRMNSIPVILLCGDLNISVSFQTLRLFDDNTARSKIKALSIEIYFLKPNSQLNCCLAK